MFDCVQIYIRKREEKRKSIAPTHIIETLIESNTEKIEQQDWQLHNIRNETFFLSIGIFKNEDDSVASTH
ncbi:hypothetical protein BLOT_007376 [Blomia tropicalis]|nr:hypothetical protein BLOT_007376 [Blomia tropicalis]